MIEFAVPPDDRIEPTVPLTSIADIAVGIIGDAAAAYPKGAPDTKLLAFVSQYFDALAHNGEAHPYLDFARLLAASAYYLSDLPGNASVLAHRPLTAPLDEAGLGDLLRRFLDDPATARGAALSRTRPFSPLLRTFQTLLHQFVETGGKPDEVIKTSEELNAALYEAGTASELLLGDIMNAAVCRHVLRYSPWTALPGFSGLAAGNWKDFLAKKKPFRELWPSQMAIGDQGVFRGASAAIQIPTSGGKTKAVSLAIRSSFMSNRAKLAVVVAPFNALCREIAADLQNDFRGERDIQVGLLPDVRNSDAGDLLGAGKKSIAVLTPEKLDYLLRVRPDLAAEIGLIVYDEGHLLDEGNRGPNFELLVSSLKTKLPPNAQVIFISAVVPNIAEIGTWLAGADCKIVQGAGLSPMRRSIALVNWSGRRAQLQFVTPDEPDRDEFFVPRMVDEYPLELRGRERKERVFPAVIEKVYGRRTVTYREPSHIGVLLGSRLVQSGGVAIFCGRKDSTVKLARDAVEAFSRGLAVAPPSVACNREELKRHEVYFAALLGEDSPVAGVCKLGILLHHGSMPLGARLSVEYAIQQQHAKMVVCTSTLAQGVNLPIKYLLVGGTSQGEDEIKVRDFHNLIGRAGRAGKFTEGVIIFIDPRVHQARGSTRYTAPWDKVKELLNPARAGSCSSLLLDSVSDPPQEPEALEAWRGHRDACHRIIESFLLLSLEEVDDEDAAGAAAAQIATKTLAYQQGNEEQKARLVTLFDEIGREIVLTEPNLERRRIFSRTGVGLNQSAALAELVAAKVGEEEPTTIEEALAHWWEAIYPLMPKLTSALPAGRALETAQLWISGEALPRIKASLDGLKHGNRSFSLEDCVTLCENEFGFQGSLLVGSIAELLDEDAPAAKLLRLLQRALKAGLATPQELAIYDRVFPDRQLAIETAQMIAEDEVSWIPTRIFEQRDAIAEILQERYPAYFSRRLEEFTAEFM